MRSCPDTDIDPGLVIVGAQKVLILINSQFLQMISSFNETCRSWSQENNHFQLLF